MAGELFSSCKLYNHDGSVNFGWSKQPVFDLNIEDAKFLKIRSLQKYRTKKWDFQYVITDRIFFTAAVVNSEYLGSSFVYIYDYSKNSVTEDAVLVPFASNFVMARNSISGVTEYKNDKIDVSFNVGNGVRKMTLKYPGFNNGQGVEAEISLYEKDIESICIATPLNGGKMNYTRKSCCMPAEGYIKWGNDIYDVKKERDLGGIDWSRGFLEHKTFWNWACASDRKDGHTVGLNLCRGLNDTLDTENAFFIDGKCHKVDRVMFDYNIEERMEPWVITSNDGRVDLKFIPYGSRLGRTNAIILKSELNQMFGEYFGKLKLEDGNLFEVNGIRGTIEDHNAKW